MWGGGGCRSGHGGSERVDTVHRGHAERRPQLGRHLGNDGAGARPDGRLLPGSRTSFRRPSVRLRERPPAGAPGPQPSRRARPCVGGDPGRDGPAAPDEQAGHPLRGPVAARSGVAEPHSLSEAPEAVRPPMFIGSSDATVASVVVFWVVLYAWGGTEVFLGSRRRRLSAGATDYDSGSKWGLIGPVWAGVAIRMCGAVLGPMPRVKSRA